MSWLNKAGSWLKENCLGGVTKLDATPQDKDINDAYKLTFTIRNEGTYSTAFNSKDNTFRNMRHFDRVIITGYCPDKITLGFRNKFDTVNPFAIGSSSLVQAGFQLFTGHSSVHRVNNISVWQGSEPLSMTVKLQLFATNNKQHVNINSKNISTHTKGISPQDLLDIIMLLTSLAQPSCGDNDQWMVPPGPAPLIVKFKGHKFEVNEDSQKLKIVRKDKNGKEGGLETIDAVTTSGVSVEVTFGNFLKLSHVIVESVNVDIPYVMTQVGSKGLPTMAEITISFRTKMMVTQQNFAKMLNNESQKNPAMIDITNMKGIVGNTLNGFLAMSQDYAGKAYQEKVNSDEGIDKSQMDTSVKSVLNIGNPTNQPSVLNIGQNTGGLSILNLGK